eukprot:6612105-Prymnesium_polylepis.1
MDDGTCLLRAIREEAAPHVAEAMALDHPLAVTTAAAEAPDLHAAVLGLVASASDTCGLRSSF